MEIRKNEPVAVHTRFGVGGTVGEFVLAHSWREFLRAIKYAQKNKKPLRVIAGGTNVVFEDGDLPVFLVKMASPELFNEAGRKTKIFSEYIKVKEKKDGVEIECDGAVKLIDLVLFAAGAGFCGTESLAGIPGTVAGATVGNAGAYGQDVSSSIKKVNIYDGKKTRWLSQKECRFAYRDSVFKHKPWFVLKVVFVFGRGSKKGLTEKSRGIIGVRNKKFDPSLKCPGSFFQNVLVKNISDKARSLVDATKIVDGLPAGQAGKIPAGYLLESVGAKGMMEGGVAVADFHGNVIWNKGGATCADLKRLVARLKKLVKEKFDIDLVEEVRYLK